MKCPALTHRRHPSVPIPPTPTVGSAGWIESHAPLRVGRLGSLQLRPERRVTIESAEVTKVRVHGGGLGQSQRTSDASRRSRITRQDESAPCDLPVARRAPLNSDHRGSNFSRTKPRGEGRSAWKRTSTLDTVSSEGGPPPTIGPIAPSHRALAMRARLRPLRAQRAPVVPVSPAQGERTFLARVGIATRSSRVPTSASSTR